VTPSSLTLGEFVVGLRLVTAVVFAALILARASLISFGQTAKGTFPRITIDSWLETRGDSRDSSAAATQFRQTFKLEPYLPAFELPGLLVNSTLEYSARIDGTDYPTGTNGGRTYSEYKMQFGAQDRYGRLQFGTAITNALSLQPAGPGNAYLRGDPRTTRQATMALKPPLGPTVAAYVTQQESSSFYNGQLGSGSEIGSGGFNATHQFPTGKLWMARSVSDSETYPGGISRSSETTVLEFENAFSLPLGNLHTKYNYQDASNNAWTAPGEVSSTQTEAVETGLSGWALNSALDYNAGYSQRRTVAPDGSATNESYQNFALGYRPPLPGGATARVGLRVNESQVDSAYQDRTTSQFAYDLSYSPNTQLSLSVNATERQTTDERVSVRVNAESAVSGSLTYQPHSRFSAIASLNTSKRRDYRMVESEWNTQSVSLSTSMQVSRSLSLNLGLSDASTQNLSSRLLGDRDDDSSRATVGFNFRPSPQILLNGSFSSSAYHYDPGNNKVDQNLTLTFKYDFAPNAFWQFIYRSDDDWYRGEPLQNRHGDTVSTSFQFRF